MSNSLGAVYQVHSGTAGESLGLPTFENAESIDPQGLLENFSLPNGACFYNAVVALAVQRILEDGSTQILTGIRTDSNETHPDVVSVPTEVRAMNAIAASLDEDTVRTRPDANTLIFSGQPKTFERTRHCYSTHIGELATHMLAIKLGLGDRVEDVVVGGAEFRYQNLHLGFSKVGYDPDTDEDMLEAIAMLNIEVTIPASYSNIFPGATRELTQLTWVNDADFARGLEERDASAFFGEQLDDAAGCWRLRSWALPGDNCPCY